MKNISGITFVHYIKLIYRSVFLLLFLYGYFFNDAILGKEFSFSQKNPSPFMLLVLIVFCVEMILRFVPGKYDSMGCKKHISKNYRPTGTTKRIKRSYKQVLIIGIVWIILNSVFGGLYLTGVFDKGAMFLICLFYSVCDMICVLFFCPFQTIFMKNRCCVTCRIYNWDYIMMFTPLLFICSVYTLILCSLAALLLIVWEVSYFLHPERFSENNNACLACSECSEKVCINKNRFRKLFKKRL